MGKGVSAMEGIEDHDDDPSSFDPVIQEEEKLSPTATEQQQPQQKEESLKRGSCNQMRAKDVGRSVVLSLAGKQKVSWKCKASQVCMTESMTIMHPLAFPPHDPLMQAVGGCECEGVCVHEWDEERKKERKKIRRC